MRTYTGAFKKRVRTWFNGKAAKKVKKAFKDIHNKALEQATAPEATAREGIQAGYTGAVFLCIVLINT